MFQDKATSFANDALMEIRRNGYALATGSGRFDYAFELGTKTLATR